MKRYTLVLMSFLLTPLVLHAAGVYKWVDENGKIQYGDRPGNALAQQVPLQAAPPPDPNVQKRQEQQDKLVKVQEEERKLKDKEVVDAKKKDEERQQQCMQAKTRLKNYERARYLYKAEEGDKEAILSDGERAVATEENKKLIEEICE
ncbi:MAG: DUF4124 domain-containing protein [Gammaproteobacteria bacterium]